MKNILIGSLIVIVIILNSCKVQVEDPWEKVDEILTNISEPVFPDKSFNIIDYGAVGDSLTDCTNAFKKAIQKCNESGGGVVLVPEGVFFTGAIHLLSNVNLHVSEGATILFSNDENDYLPLVHTRFEGIDLMNYSPLIYAYKQENIAVTGKGVIDGNATDETWWFMKGSRHHGWEEGMPHQAKARQVLFEMADNHVPVQERVFGPGHYLRSSFVQFSYCKNILISDVTILRSPMWELHPIFCENITVRGVKISTHGPNNDGFDPESCKNILVEDCYFDTGDDCIAIKSGREEDGRKDSIPSENIIIRNCEMKDGHGGVVIGSEISGGCNNVFVENCKMSSPNLDRALRIKTNSLRGGLIENIYMRNCEVGEVKQAVLLINYFYEQGDVGKFDPIVRNIYLENITSQKSKYGVYLRGFERDPITDIYVKNCNFNGVKEGNLLENVERLVFEEVYINGEIVKNK